MSQNKLKHIREFLSVFPMIILMFGSVFIVSNKNFDLFETYRKSFTILGGLALCFFYSIFLLTKKGRFELSLDYILKSFCMIGLIETIYAMFQFFHLIPSFNRYFAFTGSFDNPAIFAMLLSLCVPISVFYAVSEKRNILFWWLITMWFFIFIVCSESRSGMIASILAIFFVCYKTDNKLCRLIITRRYITLSILIALIILYLLYRYKSDSADGRILIWKVSMDMFTDKPILGWGKNGFMANYMEYQAEYFKQNPDSSFTMVADNSNNPFNEFVLVMVNFGLVGVVVLISMLYFLIRSLIKYRHKEQSLFLGLIITLFIWSLFSYPYSVPFVWIVTMVIVCVLFLSDITDSFLFKSIYVVILACPILFSLVLKSYKSEFEWNLISQKVLSGNIEFSKSDYEKLHSKLSNNGRFLYNYGATLHYYGYYGESLKVLKECADKLNDYDVQMLIADDYQNLGDTIAALEGYSYAGQMIPSKFLPQYYIMNLYLDMGDSLSALKIAESIVAKEVKNIEYKSNQRIIKEANDLIDHCDLINN